MNTIVNNWHVITGAPSSGKSTLIQALSDRGFTIFEEVGRKVIDQQMAAGSTLDEIKVDSPQFEETWVERQQQAEAKLNKEDLIFFDRGILDTLGYFDYYGWPLTAKIKQYTQQASYGKVFLLGLLDYEKDYCRIETAETAIQLQKSFQKVYEDGGYNVTIIPPDTVENRLDLILASLEHSLA